MLEEIDFGVIDVIDLQLKALPQYRDGTYARFVALSYVWGKPQDGKEPYQTKRSNILDHLQHAGLEPSKFPKAIQDAIDLVHQLGLRYIWIDSLCIVQDSARSLGLNAAVMHLIYGHASLTICAADGIDSNTGLVAMNTREATDQMEETCGEGVRLLVSRPAETVIQDSRWDKCAWTFQVRILSRRCLIFAEGRVYFQCRTTGMSEDIHTDGRGTGWSLDSSNAPLGMLHDIDRRAVWFYMKCVALYTGRRLTKPKDMLAAFKGISSLIEGTLRAPFLFGLPTSHMDLAMLWEPQGVIKRRRPKKWTKQQYERLSDQEKAKSEREKVGFGDMEFPSWSWSGWMGAKMEYKNDMLEGSLDDGNQWLRKHTWIRYYVRDGRGYLRQLWDKAVMGEDGSSERRWKGYQGEWFSEETRFIG
jgi:hypothetical protein